MQINSYSFLSTIYISILNQININRQLETTPKMLKHCTESQQQNIILLLYTYKYSIEHGRFDRKVSGIVSENFNASVQIIEGRWHSEIKRTKKFGPNYDWKTMLNTRVLKNIAMGNKNTELIDKLIIMIQKNATIV